MLFHFLSSSEETPTLSHVVWFEWECHISSGECLGPPYITWGCSESQNGLGKQKGGQTWSEVNGKCSDQVDMSCKCIQFHTFLCAARWLGSHSSHPFTETNACKTLTMGNHRHRLCSVRLWKGEEERGRERERRSEWLHQVLIYHDSTCTRSIKNYLGTEHWPLSNK